MCLAPEERAGRAKDPRSRGEAWGGIATANLNPPTAEPKLTAEDVGLAVVADRRRGAVKDEGRGRLDELPGGCEAGEKTGKRAGEGTGRGVKGGEGKGHV